MSECYKIIVETRKSPAGGLYQDVYRIEVTHDLEDVEIQAEIKKQLWDKEKGEYFEGWEITGHIKAQRCRKCKQLFWEGNDGNIQEEKEVTRV